MVFLWDNLIVDIIVSDLTKYFVLFKPGICDDLMLQAIMMLGSQSTLKVRMYFSQLKSSSPSNLMIFDISALENATIYAITR